MTYTTPASQLWHRSPSRPTLTSLQVQCRAEAIKYHRWGLNVLAIKAGEKRPGHIWKGGGDGKGPNWTTTPQAMDDVLDFPWHNAGGMGVVNGPGGGRTIDIDQCSDVLGVAARILDAMDLPPDYRHTSQSGSGGRILVICHEDLPETLAPSGVLTCSPREASDFDHIELRMRETQTVMPPSRHPTGRAYTYLYGEPTEAPAVVSRDQLLAGLLAVAKMPEPKPQPEVTVITSATKTCSADPDADYRRIIDRVNAEAPVTYLTSLGSVKMRDGTYSCPCGAAHAPKKGQISIGRTVVYCHSDRPDCKLSKDLYKRGLDRWGLEVALEYGGSQKAALLAHGWQPPEPKAEENPYPARSEVERKQESADRAERRKRAAEAQRIMMTERADTYGLPERAHITLDALLHIANGVTTIRPSIARLVRDTGMCERRVVRALNDLEGVCIQTEEHVSPNGNTYRGGGNQTAKRTFLKTPARGIGTPQSANEGVTVCEGCACVELCLVSPKVDLDLDLSCKALDLVSGAPPDSPDEAGAFDTDACDDSVLAWLYEQERAESFTENLQLQNSGQHVEPKIEPQVVSVGTPDARGMQLVRWSNGSASWRRTLNNEETASANICGSEPEADGPGASYTPALDWTAGGRLDLGKAPDPPPVVVQLEPLVQAPPLATDPTFPDFIWRWHASRQKERSEKQRARFKREAESYLVDVSPAEAALRWDALRQARSGKEPPRPRSQVPRAHIAQGALL